MNNPPEHAAGANPLQSGPAQAGPELRGRAEARARAAAAPSPENIDALSPEATRHLLHELRVHQIELEMQNEELRRAQVALEVASARYFDLYDLAPVGYCTVTEAGLIVQANLTAATLLGSPRLALAKQALSRFIAKTDQDVFYLCRKQLFGTGSAQSCELRMVKQDATEVWVQLTATEALEPAIGPVMRVVMHDISDRKLLQAAMQDREARYRAMVEWSPEPVLVHRAGTIIYANQAALRLFGSHHPHDLIGKPVFDRIHPDFHAVAQARLTSMTRQNLAAPMVELWQKVDGSAIDVEVQSLLTEFDGGSAVQLAIHDVTERNRAGKALFESQLRLRQALDAAELGTWNIDPLSGRLTTDQRFQAIFGAAVEGFTVEQAVANIHPDDRDRIRAAVAAATRPDDPAAYEVEYRVLHADGAIAWVLAKGGATFALSQAGQKLLSFGGTVMDVTARKRAEFQLIEAKAVAEKASLAKSDFLSSMSHEFRTPLNAILGFAQLLASATPAPTDSQQRSIGQILQAGWYLLELVNGILDLAQIESGKLALSMEPVSLADVLLECQAMVEQLAINRGVSLAFPGFDTPQIVKVDRTRIKQVLINLLSNAIKYNQPGGRVALRYSVLDAGHIRVSVEDTGFGMGPDQLAQLFQPFNRLGQQGNAGEGTGIGLVVSKRLIEGMGGSIGVQSTLGAGSVFWIEMELVHS